MTRFILIAIIFISIRNAASIDYVDVSSGEVAGDDVDAVAPPAASPIPQDKAAVLFLVSADVHVVMLGLQASSLRCAIVYVLVPVIDATGPLAIGAALVTQTTGTAISVSDVFSLRRRRERDHCVYALTAALTCPYAMAALLTPTGSQPVPISATVGPTITPLPSPPSRTRRAMVFVRHWLSAAAGLGILIVTIDGMLLPHQEETLRALNPTVSTHDANPGQDPLPQVVEVVKNIYPDEPVLSTRWDIDVIEVRTEQVAYTVNPATRYEISRASAAPV